MTGWDRRIGWWVARFERECALWQIPLNSESILLGRAMELVIEENREDKKFEAQITVLGNVAEAEEWTKQVITFIFGIQSEKVDDR